MSNANSHLLYNGGCNKMKQIGKLKTKSSAEIKSTRIGLGFEGYDRWHYKPERCYDLAAQTGSKIARLNSGWMRTEREVGVYDFAWLDWPLVSFYLWFRILSGFLIIIHRHAPF